MIKKEQILQAYNFRHACKIFDKNKKISKDNFNTILEAGRLSPSSFGFEPWRFLIVQNKNLREKLKLIAWGAQGTMPTASHFMIILARKLNDMKYDSKYISHMMLDIHKLPKDMANARKKYYEAFLKNDFDILKDDKNMFDWACKQTYITLGNMMSTAAMLGIDSCPIEGFNYKQTQELLANDFEVDTNKFGASVMVAFGYRENKQNKKTRQNINDISKWYN